MHQAQSFGRRGLLKQAPVKQAPASRDSPETPRRARDGAFMTELILELLGF